MSKVGDVLSKLKRRYVARNLLWGGAVLNTEKNVKRSWPWFYSSFDQFESFFSSNWGVFQKNLHRNLNGFSGQN